MKIMCWNIFDVMLNGNFIGSQKKKRKEEENRIIVGMFVDGFSVVYSLDLLIRRELLKWAQFFFGAPICVCEAWNS